MSPPTISSTLSGLDMVELPRDVLELDIGSDIG
jgi:hypothetical protein